MEPRFVRGDAERFVQRLGYPGREFCELRLIDPASANVRQHFCRSVSEAITLADDASARLNVYVGACPRFRRGGTKDDISTVVAAWADLDFHQIDPTNRDVALELAYRRIESLGIPPTMLVHTGNGLQVWWLFHEPAAITDAWPAERFEAINIGLAQRLGGDHVHDLARVLRVPGTINLPDSKKQARGCVPVVTRLVSSDGPSYSPEILVTFAVAAHTCTRPRESKRMAQTASESSPDVLDAFHRLVERVGPHHPLSRTWLGRRRLADPSRSAFDMALACQMARLRIRPELAAIVLRVNPCGKGTEATEQYIHRTIDRAYAKCGSRHGR